uniref:Legumain n=1 Tax=Angiostrongylus cantonensis TaxID=6313 RepID=A0A0K0DED5_ANGCA
MANDRPTISMNVPFPTAYSSEFGVSNESESDLQDDGLLKIPKGNLHALLVAGSNGWWNYRHQADTAHAFQLLKKNGLPEDNIIVMMYDDIANDPDNPFPGKLFNRPHGPDVYAGLKIDYKGDSVTPGNFLNVLQGNAQNVTGGNGRVISSTSNDRIFVYFTDHGGEGLIAFPDDILTKEDLNTALQNMHEDKRYDQLVFYLESKRMIEERNVVEDLKCHNDVVKAFDSICVDVNKVTGF